MVTHGTSDAITEHAQHIFMATHALPESPGTSKDMVSHTGYIHYPSDSSTENNDCYLEHCK